MNTLAMPTNLKPQERKASTFTSLMAQRLVFHTLKNIYKGRLTVIDGSQVSVFGETQPADGLDARIVVHHSDIWKTILTRGSIGAGEGWMAGHWSSPDLTAVIRIFVRNRDVMNTLDGSSSLLARLAMKAVHHLNRNTVEGSRRNISAHYDLSNAFFKLFLDPTLMYSSAIYAHPGQSLADASRHKLDVVCHELKLKPSDHLVEIGSGWGGMAIHAAKHYGCRVTTVTISHEQYEYARQRIAEENLSDRITLLLKDYRELQGSEWEGQFDKLVSIEMIEAVGADFQAEYFRICSGLLKPGGLALIQAITIDEALYEAYLNDTDFIRHYIFPGGCLPTLERMETITRQHTALRLQHNRDITLDYAQTLRDWYRNFLAEADAIKALGFDDRFLRMWEFYLCYCEGGFIERSIGTYQVTFSKVGRESA